MRDGDIFQAQKTVDEKGSILALLKFSEESAKMTSNLRDAILQIQKDDSLTKSEKKLKIKDMELAEKKAYDEFLKFIDQAKKN